MKTNRLPPIHPGEILREEFMKPRGLSQNALARALNVPPRRINEIVLEKRGITADMSCNFQKGTFVCDQKGTLVQKTGQCSRTVDLSLWNGYRPGLAGPPLRQPDQPFIRLQTALGLRPRRAPSSAETGPGSMPSLAELNEKPRGGSIIPLLIAQCCLLLIAPRHTISASPKRSGSCS